MGKWPPSGHHFVTFSFTPEEEQEALAYLMSLPLDVALLDAIALEYDEALLQESMQGCKSPDRSL